MATPWHEGERALQARAGVAGRMAAFGPRAIRAEMPEQHRQFFAQLPFILAGFEDAAGHVWASLIGGLPGFVSSPDSKTLSIVSRPLACDPLAAALASGLPLGLLGIELPTRRRNRANGHVRAVGPDGFTVEITESFGNCPKYIARRDYGTLREIFGQRDKLNKLDDSTRGFIAASTTFFIASSGGSGLLPDISHRGGPPGFIRIESDGTLTIPDYAGNFYFNTLGNIVLNPHAGLLFPDFVSGDVLQLSGTAWLVETDRELNLPGAERLWRFRMAQGHWARGAIPVSLTAAEDSSFWPLASRGSAVGDVRDGYHPV